MHLLELMTIVQLVINSIGLLLAFSHCTQVSEHLGGNYAVIKSQIDQSFVVDIVEGCNSTAVC